MTQLGCKRFFSPKFQVNRWMRCQSQFHTPVLAPEPGFCVTKPGCKLFLLFQIKTNLFPKYLQVLLKQRLPNHTYLNWNASKTGTKFWFNNIPWYSNGSIYIDTLASNLSPYTTKVIGLLSGFWWGFWRGRFKKQQTFCKHSNLERCCHYWVLFHLTSLQVMYYMTTTRRQHKIKDN